MSGRRRRGCGKRAETCAQDPADVEQGLTSVRYEAGEFADELEALEAAA
jgi:hypothetical protein